jgi:type II secretory pathway component PulJ
MTRRLRSRAARRGFSLVEISVATGLLVMLSILLSNIWLLMGRPMLQTIYLCRIAQEADVALAYLSTDLGACPPDSATGTKLAGQFVGWVAPSETEFMLCFDSSSDPNGLPEWNTPDQVIGYSLVDGTLVRYNASTGDESAVARDVQAFDVQIDGDTLELTITFAHRGVSRTYSLIAGKP